MRLLMWWACVSACRRFSCVGFHIWTGAASKEEGTVHASAVDAGAVLQRRDLHMLKELRKDDISGTWHEAAPYATRLACLCGCAKHGTGALRPNDTFVIPN